MKFCIIRCSCLMLHVVVFLRPTKHTLNYPISFRNFREFGVITNDPTVWWKAGLSLAAVTALGLLVAKVLHTSDKVR